MPLVLSEWRLTADCGAALTRPISQRHVSSHVLPMSRQTLNAPRMDKIDVVKQSADLW